MAKRAQPSKYPPELDNHFTIKDTIGAGGFAKVKAARHKLTGEKVAIKIMDKAALRQTNDLERVYLEIQALKDLNHQNISRLYYVHETSTKFYLVLEFAVGGELFDYIVARERCKEEEARVFFRQIASAVAFCHQNGIAHRDLKPENLLLDTHSNIKLIDFGLIARPNNLYSDMLSTCCGSAAYAAPELIRGEKYLGPQADMWSLGILLYALLCGFLPFDDDNTQRLYRLIQRGTYEIPPWLSNDSQKVIGSLLKHRPESRLSMDQLLQHPWLLKGTKLKKIDPSSTMGSRDDLNPVVVTEMAKYYSLDVETMTATIKKWEYDHVTCNYELLNRKQRKGQTIRLPAGKSGMDPLAAGALVRSKMQQSVHTAIGGSMDNLHLTAGSMPAGLGSATVAHRAIAGGKGKRDPIPQLTHEHRSNSVGISGKIDLSKLGRDDNTLPPLSQRHKDEKAFSSHTGGLDSAGQSEPKQKFGSVRNLFGSLGSLFGSRDNLTQPRKVKALFNVKTTSTKEANDVLAEVNRVLVSNGYEVKDKGFLLKARKHDPDSKKNVMAINFEICAIDKVDLTGIRLVRVKGDTWAYKRETERLLNQMRL